MFSTAWYKLRFAKSPRYFRRFRSTYCVVIHVKKTDRNKHLRRLNVAMQGHWEARLLTPFRRKQPRTLPHSPCCRSKQWCGSDLVQVKSARFGWMGQNTVFKTNAFTCSKWGKWWEVANEWRAEVKATMRRLLTDLSLCIERYVRVCCVWIRVSVWTWLREICEQRKWETIDYVGFHVTSFVVRMTSSGAQSRPSFRTTTYLDRTQNFDAFRTAEIRARTAIMSFSIGRSLLTQLLYSDGVMK